MGATDDSRRWQRLSVLLDELLDLEERPRAARLERLQASDPALAAEITPLLAAAVGEHPLLDQPLGDLADDLLDAAVGDDPAAGRLIGPWRLGRCLGRGGMGVVYAAERADGQYEQRVAVKLLDRLDHGGDLARRLENERRILARLDHPGIARLRDGGVTPEGMPWFAMDFVDGEPLTVHCDERRLPVRRRVRLFLDVCAAVAYAHGHLVVHRDLKPSNILVTAAGEVKLVDFGVAKLLDDTGTGGPEITRPGDRVMTPSYAAPEQVRGEAVTTATDVYALGAVLYELLSGHRAHGDGDASALEVERAVLTDDPPPLDRVVTRPAGRRVAADGAGRPTPETVGAFRGTSARQLRRALGGDPSTIVAKALAKRPQDRYGSVAALQDDLERWLGGLPVRARRPTVRYRLAKYVRRHRLEIAASGLVMIALAAGLAGTAWQAQEAARQARRAERSREFLVQMFTAVDPASHPGREVTARDILERGAARIEAELAGDPSLAAELLLTVGGVYHALGYDARAETLLTAAHRRARSVYGAGSLEAARAGNLLGACLQEQGRVDEAEALFRQAHAVALDRAGPRHAETLAGLGNLGGVARRRGRYAEAIRIYREVLDRSREAFGADYPELDQDLNNLAVALDDDERLAEADSIHALVLDLRRSRHGPLHPSVAMSLHNRAEVLANLGRSAEAESLWAECIGMRRIIHPDGHPDLARTLTSYASHLRDLGSLDQAAALLEEAAAMHRRLNPAGSDELARTLNSLGTLAYSRGQMDVAAARLREALGIWRTTLGAESPAALTTMNNLAVILHRAGRLAEARPLFAEVLDARRRLLEPDSVDLAFSYKGLGMLTLDEGRPAEAEPLLAQALAGLQRRYDDDSPAVAEVLLGLGECRLAAGDGNAARILLIRSQGTLAAVYTPEHAMVRRVAAALARLGSDGSGSE